MEAVKILRHCETRVLPKLNPRLDQDRICHIRAVNNAFCAFVDGNFNSIYNALQPQFRSSTDYDRYCRTLAGLREQYFSLSVKERKELAAAVALHDIGYLEGPGVRHDHAGKQLTSEMLMTCGIRGADSKAVSEIIGAHGLYIDTTVQYLLSDLKHFSAQRKTQSLIINILDCIGKPSGSFLSQRTLDILIGLKEGKYDDPQEYFKLRMRTLLGPANYSYIEGDTEYITLLDAVETMAEEEKVAFKRNVASRFRNTSWPVFQELVMKRGELRTFFTLLKKLSVLAEKHFKDEDTIDLRFNPDFFSLQDRQKRMLYLSVLECLPEDCLRAEYLQGRAVLTVDMLTAFVRIPDFIITEG